MSPIWPIQLSYLIIELDSSDGDRPYDYTVVGYPSRAYCWIMCRSPSMQADLFEGICWRLVNEHGYDISNLVRVVHSSSSSAPLSRTSSENSVNLASFVNKELELFDVLKVIGKGILSMSRIHLQP